MSDVRLFITAIIHDQSRTSQGQDYCSDLTCFEPSPCPVHGRRVWLVKGPVDAPYRPLGAATYELLAKHGVGAVYVGVLSVRNWQEEGYFCLDVTVLCQSVAGDSVTALCSAEALAGALPKVPRNIVASWFNGDAPLLYVEEEFMYGAKKLPAHFEVTQEKLASHDLVVFVVVVDPLQRVLMVQEPQRKKYKWFLPAGHIDEGETLTAAVVRECREESSLIVQPLRLMHMVYGGRAFAPLHFVVEAEVVGGHLKEASEEDGESKCAQWCPLSEVCAELTPTQPFPPRNCRQEYGYRDGGHEVAWVLRHYLFMKSSHGGIPILEHAGFE